MSTILKLVAAIVALLLLLVGCFVVFVFATEHTPEDREPTPVEGTGDGPGLKVGEPFKVLSWNLQYSASRKHRFFYDGGDAVHVPEEDVRQTVDAIRGVLSAESPQLALLQEIDRDSTRTGRVDQLPAFVAGMTATTWTAAAYHKAAFVPKPFTNPLARVQMDLGILATGPLENAERHQLALMNEPRPIQALNLKRALLTAEVPVDGLEQPLAVAVTHLSAFSFGDGTLEKQVAALKEWMAARPDGQPWILAGDFNLLPPGDDKDRLATESDLYADQSNPVETLLPGFRELFGDQQLDPSVRTYLPFGAAEPDRKIDYFFVGGPIDILQGDVLRAHSAISDHLPIRAVLRIQDPSPPTPPPVDDPAAEGAASD